MLLIFSSSAVLLLRNPQYGQSINMSMRIRLSDLSTVCFFSAENEKTGCTMEHKFVGRSKLISTHPLYFLVLVFELRSGQHTETLERSLSKIYEIESATEMTMPSWKIQVDDVRKEWLSDYDNLLKRLHECHAEMCHFDTVNHMFEKWGKFLIDSLDLLKQLREENGLPPMSRREYRALDERIRFTLTRCQYMTIKTMEMLGRVKGQINVVCQVSRYVPGRLRWS